MGSAKPNWTKAAAVDECIDQLKVMNIGACMSQLNLLRAEFVGEFSVEHLRAAEKWDDWLECLIWAMEARATVKEMILWHRSKNGIDFFAEE